jgi:hypothetical protein
MHPGAGREDRRRVAGTRAAEYSARRDAMQNLGPLVPADETLNHQITDTFATVVQTDPSWTEKVWATASARDGSLQLVLGLGKYTNRGVMDACAGVSRGVEQWAVRTSRLLAADPGAATVGPIRYEVLEPLRTVRFVLDATDAAPVRFEWILDGVVPPALENREVHRSRDGYRVSADVVRYHHVGAARGWVEVAGRRIELDPAAWVGTRDHSWGVRYMVGAPLDDVPPAPLPPELAILMMWCPILCERPDGSRYALHWYYQRHTVGDFFDRIELQGGAESPDGARDPFVALVPDVRFRDDNRRFLGGVLRFTTAGGAERPLTVTPVSDTGFHLGMALYFGLDGKWHGQWRDFVHVEGDHAADCAHPATARRLHQLRDCIVRVEDPVGGGVGWGNLQSLAVGPHPALGLTADASFM